MDKDIYSDAGLKQYLLGEISDKEREQIETRYLANKDFLDQLLAVEDDLVDEYARGELSSNEREQFERKLLATPKQRQKLLRAKRLLEAMRTRSLNEARATKQKPATTTSWFSFSGLGRIPALAGGFALLLLFVVSGWLLIRERRLNAELKRMQAEHSQMQQRQQDLQSKLLDEQKEKSELLQQLQNLPQVQPAKESPTAPTIATFILPLTLVRGGGEATSFTLQHGADMVQLQAQVANVEYKSYQAELRTADGASIYRLIKLKARKTGKGNALLLRIPAQLFKVSDYVLKVSGVADSGQLEDAGLYSFRIIRN